MQQQLNHQIFNMVKFIFFRWIRSSIHLADCIRVILEERKCNRSACLHFSWSKLIYVHSSFLSKSVRYTYSCLPDLFCVYRLYLRKHGCCEEKQYRLDENVVLTGLRFSYKFVLLFCNPVNIHKLITIEGWS